MALNFPDSPVLNQVFTDPNNSNAAWVWDGQKWNPLSVAQQVSPVGVIAPFAGTVAPARWLLCYGQPVSRVTYSLLFSVISTVYGVGDGSTTFNLPDLRGRTVFGLDNMGGAAASRMTGAQLGGLNANTPGAVGGEQGHTNTQGEMAPHSHSVTGGTDQQGSHQHQAPGSGSFLTNQGGNNVYTSAGGFNINHNMGPWTQPAGIHSHNVSGTAATAGGGAAHNNVPPAMALNYIICAGA